MLHLGDSMNASGIEGKRDYRLEVMTALRSFAALTSTPSSSSLAAAFLPEELCRLWFDEVYLASERYFDSAKGDVNQSLVAHFLQQFSAEECRALERFHRSLEIRLELVEKHGQQLAESELWRNICRDAGNTLYFFE